MLGSFYLETMKSLASKGRINFMCPRPHALSLPGPQPPEEEGTKPIICLWCQVTPPPTQQQQEKPAL